MLKKLDSKLRDKIQRQLKIGNEFSRDTSQTSDTPYTTIVHRDLWINNIMIKKGTFFLVSPRSISRIYLFRNVFILSTNFYRTRYVSEDKDLRLSIVFLSFVCA